MPSKSKVVKALSSSSTGKQKNLTEFDKKVYEFCSKIPEGKVSTYKEIAIAIDRPKAFRAVGTSLRNNPFAPKVPCHRVVASDRSLGGFYGSTDKCGPLLKKKIEMLKNEGVSFEDTNAEHNVKVSADCIHTF